MILFNQSIFIKMNPLTRHALKQLMKELKESGEDPIMEAKIKEMLEIPLDETYNPPGLWKVMEFLRDPLNFELDMEKKSNEKSEKKFEDMMQKKLDKLGITMDELMTSPINPNIKTSSIDPDEILLEEETKTLGKLPDMLSYDEMRRLWIGRRQGKYRWLMKDPVIRAKKLKKYPDMRRSERLQNSIDKMKVLTRY